MWPSNPDRWKDVLNSFAVIGILLGMLVLLLFIGRSANGFVSSFPDWWHWTSHYSDTAPGPFFRLIKPFVLKQQQVYDLSLNCSHPDAN
jgi:hypothetical protein